MAEETTRSEAVTITSNPLMTAQEVGTVWGYGDSDQAERYFGHLATREDAISEGRAHYGVHTGFWVVRGKEHSPSEFTPDADWILDDMSERAGDTVGEVAEDWPDVTPEQKKDLQKLLDDWVNKNLECRFWTTDGDPEYIEPEEKDEPASNDAASIGGG
jgi:hypothetical protein